MIGPNLSVAAVAAAAGLALTPAAIAGQDIQWAAASDGIWAVPSNWNPANVPDNPGERAALGFNAPYTVTLNGTVTVGGVLIPNALAKLDIAPGALFLPVADVVNNGTIRVNPDASATDARVRFDASAALTGTGSLILSVNYFPDDAQLLTNGATITQGSDHTIRGAGYIGAALVNNGTVLADTWARILRLSGGAKTNNGLFAVSNGGELAIDNVTVIQGPDGVILAEDNYSTVRHSAASVVGGTLATEGTGVHWVEGAVTFNAITNKGFIDVRPDALLIVKNGLINDGDIALNFSGMGVHTQVRFDTDVALGGAGSFVLYAEQYNPSTAEVHTNGTTLTQGPEHQIYGSGLINAALVNNGVVRADNTEHTLQMTGGPVTNNHHLEAAVGGILAIDNVTVTQGPSGLILAWAAGDVNYTSMTLNGGEVSTESGGVQTINSTVTFDGVKNSGDLRVNPGASLLVVNGLTNDGVITVNPDKKASDAIVRFDTSAVLAGAGEVFLRANQNDPGDAQLLTSNATLTQGPDHLIHGAGSIGGSMVNNGTILADTPGGTLLVQTGLTTNNGLIAASGGGTLALANLTVTQGQDGLVLSQDASTAAFSSTIIVGGAVCTEGSGRATVDGFTNFSVVTNGGSIDVNPGAFLTVASGLTNNGVITVNPDRSSDDAQLRVDSPGEIDGVGEIILRANGDDPSDAQLSGNGAAVTLRPGQTLRGQGLLTGPVISHGTLAPGEPIGVFQSTGSLTLGESSVYEVEAAGLDSGQFDTIKVADSVAIGGALNISLIDGYIPDTCARITVLTSNSVVGAFDSVNGDPGNGRVWRAVYSAGSVDAVVTCFADMNVDCKLDLFDFLGFVNLFNAADPAADCTGEGAFDLFDFLCFTNAFNQGC